ncbi:MAG: M20/M25/M40 family metallo-hydrolase [Flavisolibacter sp.]
MKNFFLLISLSASLALSAQSHHVSILKNDVERIETTLASDDMRGRRAGTPDADRAADFIAGEFKNAGLQPFSGNSFLQSFVMVRPKLKELKYKADDADVNMDNIVVVTSQEELKVDENSGYDVSHVDAGANLLQQARSISGEKKNTITFVDESHAQLFKRLTFLKRQIMQSPWSHIFVLGAQPKEFKIKADHSFEATRFANVAAVIPGRSRKDEYVIFSGHYDHLGVGKPVDGDSIYNGANDDAAGTTAVIALAKYFKEKNDNERTLVFVAFTAEEVGGFGSRYFSEQLDPNKVAAMFNIEMIGTESQWGRNSAYITGYEKTNMGEILQKNLEGSAFRFYPDPYTKQNLFYRSDNATLARLGVPAHTISTAKMEDEPNYHKASDEVQTLDLDNMTEIIKAIAVSSQSIISGKDTPTRVKPESLN